MSPDPETRFWNFVDKTGPDGCWLWTGGNNRGYGLFWLGGQPTQVYAHRFAYELCVGPIPAGLEIDHLCFVRSCVNPDHLEAVTTSVNGQRRGERYRPQLCKYGHPYDDENTYVRPDGKGRDCRICRKRRTAELTERRQVLTLHSACRETA